jgi:hypothetical protein
MKAVSIEDMTWKPYPGQRSTTTEFIPLLQGEPGDLANYELAIVRMGTEGNFSPRHRHNFEQLRWAFDQPVPYSPQLELPPGQLGYFPEGAYYGPFTIDPGTEWLIVQFGGLSGAGYLSWDELMRGYLELKDAGEFKGGVYRRVDGNGAIHNQDGYEAVWEHVRHNQRIEYPTPKYREPIIMNPAAFSWSDDPENEGVGIRELGSFGEHGPGALLVRLAPGATYNGPRHGGISLAILISGRVTTDNRSFAQRSAFALEPGEVAGISSEDEEAELLFLNMPVFD